MSFSETDVTKKVGELLPDNAVLSRDSVPDPEQWMAGISDLVARVLHTDQDAVWALAAKLALRIKKLSTDIDTAIADLETDIAAARVQDPIVPASTQEIYLLVQEMVGAGANKRADLAARLDVAVSAYAGGSTLPSGQKYTGRDPAVARSGLVDKAEAIHSSLVTLVDLCNAYTNIVDEYNSSNLEDSANLQQAQSALAALSERGLSQDGQTQDAVLEATVISSLLTNELTKLDIEEAKTDGSVTINETIPAFVTGDALPLSRPESTYPSGMTSTVSGNGAAAGTITGAFSPSPSLVVPVFDSMLVETETYAPITGDGTQANYLGTPIYLKTYVEPGSVTVETSAGGALKTATDDGVGGFTGGVHADSNIDYNSGDLRLRFTANVDNNVPVVVSYTYHVIGKMQKYVSGANTGSFNTHKIFKDNTLVTGMVAQTTSLSTQALLASAIDAAVSGDTIDCAADGKSVVYTSDNGGSCGQLLFPDYTVSATRNTSLGGPTWSTWPANFNEAILAINSRVTRSLGTDTYLKDLVIQSAVSDEIDVTRDNNTILAPEPATMTLAAPSTLTVSDGTNVTRFCVVEFSDPVKCVIDISSVAGDVLTLARPYPFDHDTGESLLSSQEVRYRVTQNNLRYTSKKSDATSSVSVTVAGFGEVTSPIYGVPVSMTFAELRGTHYYLRPNDFIYDGTTQIGTISGKATATLTHPVAYTQSVAVALPTSVSVRSRGWVNYESSKPKIQPVLSTIEETLDVFVQEVTAYGWSGANTVSYQETLDTVKSFTSDAYDAAITFDANAVSSVNGLLRYLEEEKLTKILKLVRELKFTELSTATPEDISDEVSLEELLVAMVVELEQGDDFVETADGDTMFGDYLNRDVDTLEQLDPTFEE